MSKFINYLDLKKFVERLIQKKGRPVTVAEVQKEYSEDIGMELEWSRMSQALRKLTEGSTNLEETTWEGSISYGFKTQAVIKLVTG
jgi:hypothetical protein